MNYQEYKLKVSILKEAYDEKNRRSISLVQELQQQIIQLQILTEELNWLNTQVENDLVMNRVEAIVNDITKESAK